MDMIREEGDFESKTGTDGKPVVLQCMCDVVSGTQIFDYPRQDRDLLLGK